jgi:hypothetical protein
VIPRTTTVTWNQKTAPTIQELYALLSTDAARNEQIVRDVVAGLQNENGGTVRAIPTGAVRQDRTH